MPPITKPRSLLLNVTGYPKLTILCRILDIHTRKKKEKGRKRGEKEGKKEERKKIDKNRGMGDKKREMESKKR